MVYPVVGVFIFRSMLMRINICKSVKLCGIFTKIGTRFCLYTPYKCIKFQVDQNVHLRVGADFVICPKRRRRIRKKFLRKNWKFVHSYLGNGSHNSLQFWHVASPYRQALPQQIWWSSDKTLRIYECLKITTLLFVLMYSLPFARVQGVLGRMTHYHMSW